MSEPAVKAHPTAKCSECQCKLLKPSETGLCGFCEVELGLKEAV